MAKKQKPTLEELEGILNSPQSLVIVLPNGEIDTIDSAGVRTLREHIAELEAANKILRATVRAAASVDDRTDKRIAELEVGLWPAAPKLRERIAELETVGRRLSDENVKLAGQIALNADYAKECARVEKRIKLLDANQKKLSDIVLNNVALATKVIQAEDRTRKLALAVSDFLVSVEEGDESAHRTLTMNIQQALDTYDAVEIPGVEGTAADRGEADDDVVAGSDSIPPAK